MRVFGPFGVYSVSRACWSARPIFRKAEFHTMLSVHTESSGFKPLKQVPIAAVDAVVQPRERRLNAQAAAYLDRWVVQQARLPASQSLFAWRRYVQSVARNTPAGVPVLIEMAMSQTKSGYPEELRCPESWFEADRSA